MGKRGPKKGAVYKPTLDKIAAREAARQIITRHLEPMIGRQIAHAMGIGHVYTRDKGGKFRKIENEAEVERLLTTGEESKDYWIFMKDPSVDAFRELLNRALDRPKEQEQEFKLTGEESLIAALLAGRQRVKEARAQRDR